MQPYVAILIDSFWEAVGNRVLWALLLGWTLVLAGLAPFGYITERSFKLVSADINNNDQLKEKLVQASKGQGSDSAKAVVAKLDPKFLEQLKPDPDNERAGQRRVRTSEIARELNAAIESKDLYSAEAFPTAGKRKRLQPLIEKGTDKLDEFEREELNRELLQLAFPLELNSPRSERLWIGYAGFKLGEPLNIGRSQIKKFVEPMLLGILIKLGLGVVAVFVALIVTSPIVPETFRSGSLHLLLSKPISRIWLYMFKCLGGCVFVLFNITFVLIGLYFIAGIRFDIWNEGLLYCIPLLLFVFIIFYSVSALVGVIWGNAIVCVVACIVFWLFCFAIGAIHDGMQQQVELLPQVGRIDRIDGKILVVNQRGDVSLWNDKYSVWQPALDNDVQGQARTFGPLYDASRKQILVKSFFRAPFGPLMARSRKLSVIRLGDESTAESETDSAEPTAAAETSVATETHDLTTANATAKTPGESKEKSQNSESNRDPKSIAEARTTPYWMGESGPEFPAQLIDFVQVGGDAIAVCRGGLYRLNWSKDMGKAGDSGWIGMLRNAMPGAKPFENVAPKDFVMSDNTSAASTADGNGMIVYSSGNIYLLQYSKSRFEVLHTTKLEGEGTEPALVIANKSYCVVARDSMPIIVLDAELKPLKSDIKLPGNTNVRQLTWIPGTNEAAIVTHLGDLQKLDCADGKLSPIPSRFNKQVTTMNWESPTKVMLGLKPNRVVEYDLATKAIVKEFSPKMSTFEMVYNLGINPAYQVNPKPAALDNAMGYILSGNETQSLNIVTNNMEQAQIKLDVWSPIITNLIFVSVMLLFGCVYVARKEF